MKKRFIFLFLVTVSLLSACAKKDKIEMKMEKKNPVKETIEKQLVEEEKKKAEKGREDAEVKDSLSMSKIQEEVSNAESKDGKEKETKPVQEEDASKKEEISLEEKIAKEELEKLNGEGNPDYNPTDESVLEEGGGDFVNQFGEEEFQKMINKARKAKKKDGFDYDLTTMDGDMVYATVYLMMTDPDSFIGKKFKMRGQYYAAFYEPTNAYYHYCFISDAAGCCQQGIEFAVDSKFKYPDDFPEDAANILVTGVFEKYTEDDKIFVRLKNAVMKVE